MKPYNKYPLFLFDKGRRIRCNKDVEYDKSYIKGEIYISKGLNLKYKVGSHGYNIVYTVLDSLGDTTNGWRLDFFTPVFETKAEETLYGVKDETKV